MYASRKHTATFWMALPVIAVAVAAAQNSANAQNEAAEPNSASTSSPYAEVQNATLTGSTNVINLTMLPLVTSTGIVYKNVTVPLAVSVSSTGVVTLTTGTPTVVAAPTPVVSHFVAGTYVGPGNEGITGTQLLTLVGPGVTSNGATEWSVEAPASSTSCTYPTTATFYDGPLASNPIYARLQKAGITSTTYSYGVMGSQICYGGGGDDWYNGNIVGFSQTGNALTIVSFTYAGGEDFSTPVSQITYTLQ